MVILRNLDNQEDEDDEGVDEVDSDSDSGLGGSVPPCSVTFIGANVSTGKSSMRSKPRDFKKVRFVGKRLPKSLICLVSNTPVDFSLGFLHTMCKFASYLFHRPQNDIEAYMNSMIIMWAEKRLHF